MREQQDVGIDVILKRRTISDVRIGARGLAGCQRYVGREAVDSSRNGGGKLRPEQRRRRTSTTIVDRRFLVARIAQTTNDAKSVGYLERRLPERTEGSHIQELEVVRARAAVVHAVDEHRAARKRRIAQIDQPIDECRWVEAAKHGQREPRNRHDRPVRKQCRRATGLVRREADRAAQEVNFVARKISAGREIERTRKIGIQLKLGGDRVDTFTQEVGRDTRFGKVRVLAEVEFEIRVAGDDLSVQRLEDRKIGFEGRVEFVDAVLMDKVLEHLEPGQLIEPPRAERSTPRVTAVEIRSKRVGQAAGVHIAAHARHGKQPCDIAALADVRHAQRQVAAAGRFIPDRPAQADGVGVAEPFARQILNVAIAALERACKANGDVLRQRRVDKALGTQGVEARVADRRACSEILHIGCVRDQVDSPCQGVSTIERALWTLEDLEAADVEKSSRLLRGARAIDSVDEQADRRRCIEERIVRIGTAHRDFGVCPVTTEGDARRDQLEPSNIGDARSLKPLGCDRLNREADVLNVFRAALRGNDDVLDAAGVLGGGRGRRGGLRKSRRRECQNARRYHQCRCRCLAHVIPSVAGPGLTPVRSRGDAAPE